MCGIAGILYKDGAEPETAGQFGLGRNLITMLDGCQHRGPDSTGFALYHEPSGDDELRLRFFVGEDEEAAETVAHIKAKLAELDAEVTDEEAIGSTHRLTV